MVAVPASQCWNFKNRVGRGLLHRPASVGILEQTRNRVGRGLSYRPASAGILEQSRDRIGKGLSRRPARLHRLAESIPVLLKSLKIPSLYARPLQAVSAVFIRNLDQSYKDLFKFEPKFSVGCGFGNNLQIMGRWEENSHFVIYKNVLPYFFLFICFTLRTHLQYFIHAGFHTQY
jgi:hypothetical protein